MKIPRTGTASTEFRGQHTYYIFQNRTPLSVYNRKYLEQSVFVSNDFGEAFGVALGFICLPAM